MIFGMSYPVALIVSLLVLIAFDCLIRFVTDYIRHRSMSKSIYDKYKYNKRKER